MRRHLGDGVPSGLGNTDLLGNRQVLSLPITWIFDSGLRVMENLNKDQGFCSQRERRKIYQEEVLN